MATIKYGKGKNLKPTTPKALLATLVANADTGRVEMPDIAGSHKDSKLPTSATIGFAQTSKKTALLPLKEVTPLSKIDGVHEANVITRETRQVQVAIKAPDVLRFFSNRTKKLVSY